MALLVGRTDDAVYTANIFTGFGGGYANTGAFQALQSGTAETGEILINDFGSNTLVRVGVYEGSSPATATTLVGTFDIAAGGAGSPQSATITSTFPITAGLYYRPGCWPDVNTGPIQVASDPARTISGGSGVSTSLSGSFAAPLNPISGLENEQIDGEVYFNIDGTATNPVNAGIRVRIEIDGSPGTPLPDRDMVAWITDEDGVILSSATTYPLVGGVLELDEPGLGNIGNKAIVHIRDPSEQDPFIAVRSLFTKVLDLDAGSLSIITFRTELVASGTVT